MKEKLMEKKKLIPVFLLFYNHLSQLVWLIELQLSLLKMEVLLLLKFKQEMIKKFETLKQKTQQIKLLKKKTNKYHKITRHKK